MAIITQDKITKDPGKMNMDTTAWKYVIYQLTRTIKQLADTDKIITEQVRTFNATNALLEPHGGKQKQKSRQATTGNN